MRRVTRRHRMPVLGAAVAVAVASLACGPPVVTGPAPRPRPEPEPDLGPPSFLTDEEAPLRIDRPDRPPRASGEPVFQHVHRRPVTDLTFAGDGAVVAAISADGGVSVIDAATGEVRASWRVWVRTNEGRTVTPDRTGTRILVANAEGYEDVGDYYVWDLHTGEWLAPGAHDLAVRAVALSPDGRTLALVGEDSSGSEVLVLAATEGGHERRVQLTDSEEDDTAFHARAVRFSPGGGRVLLFAEDTSSVQIREVEEGEVTGALPAGDYGCVQVEPRPTGGVIATLGTDQRVRLHHPWSGREVAHLDLPGGQVPREIEWTPSGTRLVVWTDEGDTLLFDGSTGEPLGVLRLPDDVASALQLHVWSEDGGALYTVSDQGRVQRWDGQTGEEAGDLDVTDGAGRGDVSAIALSPDGSTVAVAVGLDVTLLDAADGRVLGRARGGVGEHSIWGASWAPDSLSLVTWGRPGVEVWGAAGARSIGCPGVGDVVWSPGGGGRYFQSDGFRGTRVCDLATGAVTDVEGLVTLSADGSTYVTADEHTLRLVDAAGGNVRRAIRLLPGERAYQVSLSTDGRLAALARDQEVRLIDERGRTRTRVHGSETIRAFEMSPDGRAIAVRYQRSGGLYSGRDGRALLLYEASGDARYPRIPTAFAPDGSAFAYAIDRDVSLVEPETGRVSATVQVPEGPRELRFSRDGTTLLVTTTSAVSSFAAPDGDLLGQVELAPVDTYDVSSDGRTVVVCSGGRIRSITLVTGHAEELGSCAPLSQGPLLSPDGRMVAIRNSALVRVVRIADRKEITLRTLRLPAASRLLAYDDDGAFWAEDATLPDLRYRAPGRITTAELSEITAAHPRRQDLVETFFTP